MRSALRAMQDTKAEEERTDKAHEKARSLFESSRATYCMLLTPEVIEYLLVLEWKRPEGRGANSEMAAFLPKDHQLVQLLESVIGSLWHVRFDGDLRINLRDASYPNKGVQIRVEKKKLEGIGVKFQKKRTSKDQKVMLKMLDGMTPGQVQEMLKKKGQ